MQKGFSAVFLLIGVILFIIISGGAIKWKTDTSVVNSDSVDDVQNKIRSENQENVYTNAKYKFSITYPNNLTFKEQTSDIYLLLVEFDRKPNNFGDNEFYVEVTSGRDLKSEIEYRRWKIVGHLADKTLSEKSIKKGNFDGYILYYDWDGQNKGRKGSATAIIKTDQYNYTIDASTSDIDILIENLILLE